MAAFLGTLRTAADHLRGDLRQAARALARRPTFTLPALATLALGIGGTTAMFSIADALLLRPLPYPDPAAIVTVATGSFDSRVPGIDSIDLQTLRDEAASFERVAAYGPASWSAALGADGSSTLSGRMVSPSVFAVLRATPHLGRLFVVDDARSGADRVVLLSFDAPRPNGAACYSAARPILRSGPRSTARRPRSRADTRGRTVRLPRCSSPRAAQDPAGDVPGTLYIDCLFRPSSPRSQLTDELYAWALSVAIPCSDPTGNHQRLPELLRERREVEAVAEDATTVCATPPRAIEAPTMSGSDAKRLVQALAS